MELTVSAAELSFESVTICAALVVFTVRAEKVSDSADNATGSSTAWPVRATLSGLSDASSAIETPAERDPDAIGVNVTVNVQPALTATLEPQLLV